MHPNMNGKLHNILRQFRILKRHIRYSPLVYPRHRQEKILSALETLYKVTNQYLRSLNVEYWLAFGTLLGYYRDGRIIAWDRDIDLGVHEKEYSAIWQGRHALPKGFKMYDTSFNHYGPKLYVTYRGWEADIFFYKDSNSQLQSYANSSYIGEVQPFPREFVYPLKETTFLGEQTNIPNDSLAYLLHTYDYIGKDAVQDKKTGYYSKKQR